MSMPQIGVELAGKTTTCVGLMARADVRLLTESLLFTDGSHVVPMRESIRLTEGSLGLLGEHHRRTLVPLGLDGGAKSQVSGQAPASFKDVRASWTP